MTYEETNQDTPDKALHPWNTAPLPDPMSRETANRLFAPNVEQEVPGASIRIAWRNGKGKGSHITGPLFKQVKKTVDKLADYFLPELYRQSEGVSLKRLFDRKTRDAFQLPQRANKRAAYFEPTSGMPVSKVGPLRACLRYGLLDALCYKDYGRAEPLTVSIDRDYVDLIIPCPLPLFVVQPQWDAEDLARALFLRDIPSSCNAPLVDRLVCAGVMARQKYAFEAMVRLWNCFGYAVSPWRLEGNNLTVRLNCVA